MTKDLSNVRNLRYLLLEKPKMENFDIIYNFVLTNVLECSTQTSYYFRVWERSAKVIGIQHVPMILISKILIYVYI